MANFKLRRSRIVHEPIKVGSLLRSSSDSGKFVKVVELVPGDYPKVLESSRTYPTLPDGTMDYSNPDIKYVTEHYDRIVVENHSQINWGQETFPKRKTRRQGYIMPYSNEAANIQTSKGADHEYWGYENAKPQTIVMSTKRVMAQGQRARAAAEIRVANQIQGVERSNEWASENGRTTVEIPTKAALLREQRTYQNPYRFNRYSPELRKLWNKGWAS